MIMPDQEMIREIAENLEMGMVCFYHKQSGQLESYPDPLRNSGFDETLFVDEMDKVEENYTDYMRIEGMDSNESFQLMENFISSLVPLRFQDSFFDAISRGKPFRRFSDLIAYYPELRRQWFDFKLEKYIDFVSSQFTEL